ncbi:MAG: molybdopterin-guanine dinucleotide biosynthesis protein B [Bacillota bacterium]
MQRYFSVVGYSGSGKTILIRSLVKELRARGYKVAVVKHDARDHGSADKKGSDTDLFWEAGSEAVILSSPSRLALFRRTGQDLPLEELLHLCGEVDCIILEGYKSRPYPRIVLWSEQEPLPYLPDAEILALVYKKEDGHNIRQQDYDRKVPLICRDDINGLANLLEQFLQREVQA